MPPVKTATLVIGLAALAAGALAPTGCVGARESSESIGVARQEDDTAPRVGFPIDIATPGDGPHAVDRFLVASRGADFLATWTDQLPDATGLLRAIRFDAAGKPIGRVQELHPTSAVALAPFVESAACAPAGDCMVIAASAPFNDGPPTMPRLDLATLTANGKVKTRSIYAQDPFDVRVQVAFDADADAFLVVWEDGSSHAQHFADNESLEPIPLTVPMGTAVLAGVACAAGHGCLVMSETDGVGFSTAVIEDSVVRAPVFVSNLPVQFLAAGGGVYAALAPIPTGWGLVRLDHDGVALDAVPLPLIESDPGQDTPLGLAFDGASFNAIFDHFDSATNLDGFRAARMLPDGTAAAPPLELAGPQVTGLACGDGVCELASAIDVAGAPALSTVALRDGVAKPSAFDLVSEPAVQTAGAAIPIGDRVLIAWNEGARARARWVDEDGSPTGDTIELGVPWQVRFGDAAGGRGLLVLESPTGARETRVIERDRTLGPGVPFTPPATPNRAPATFGAFHTDEVNQLTRLIRFDADGRALDEGVQLERNNATSWLTARAGDTFLALGWTGRDGQMRLLRIRDTGEILAPANVVIPDWMAPFDLACSSEICTMAMGASPTSPPDRQKSFATMTPEGRNLTLLAVGAFKSDIARVAFDGERFFGFVVQRGMLSATRLDDGYARFGRSPLNADVIGPIVPSGHGSVLALGAWSSPAPSPAGRVDVRRIAEVRPPIVVSGSGGGGGRSATSESVQAAGGCGCRVGDGGGSGAWTALAALALAHLTRWRRRCPRMKG